MTQPFDDLPTEPLLTPTDVTELQRAIEAGLLARDARLSGVGFADATDQELTALEDQGALARQRFIKANLGLVGMISRQHAARSQLPEAELFQEGCVGLPACQLPTGSSPCTSLSANSSIMLRSYSSIVSILSPWMPAMRSRRRVRVSGASVSMA
jgi:RNA polymerase primary sigma factor